LERRNHIMSRFTYVDGVKKIKKHRTKAVHQVLSNYRIIGKVIADLGKDRQYGDQFFAELAEDTGVSESTLRKSHTFAEKFREQDMKELAGGKFILSWHSIANSLSFSAKEIIQAYRASSNREEFHNTLQNYKNLSPVTKELPPRLRRGGGQVPPPEPEPDTKPPRISETKQKLEDLEKRTGAYFMVMSGSLPILKKVQEYLTQKDYDTALDIVSQLITEFEKFLSPQDTAKETLCIR